MTEPQQTSAPPRQLGFWMCLALVVGNMIGSGVFLLAGVARALRPATAFSAGCFTAAGGVLLAIVVRSAGARLSASRRPVSSIRATRSASAAGFVMAWGYWMSVWVGNAAIAIGSVAALSELVPGAADDRGAPRRSRLVRDDLDTDIPSTGAACKQVGMCAAGNDRAQTDAAAGGRSCSRSVLLAGQDAVAHQASSRSRVTHFRSDRRCHSDSVGRCSGSNRPRCRPTASSIPRRNDPARDAVGHRRSLRLHLRHCVLGRDRC